MGAIVKLILLEYDTERDKWTIAHSEKEVFTRVEFDKWDSLHEAVNKIREKYPNHKVKIRDVRAKNKVQIVVEER